MAENRYKKNNGLFIATTILFILQCIAFFVIVFSIADADLHGGWNFLGAFLHLLIIIPAIICLILALILILKGKAKAWAIIYSLISIVMINPWLSYPVAESFSKMLLPIVLVILFILTGIFIFFITLNKHK